MEINFSNLTPSDYAAWWGAVISSITFIYNVVIYIRSGARVKVTVSKNFQLHPKPNYIENNLFIIIKAINLGKSPTTITHCSGYYSESLFSLFIKKNRKNFIVNVSPPLCDGLPKMINPGEEWTGIADQKDLIDKIQNCSYLYMGIFHNQSNSPVYKRLKFN